MSSISGVSDMSSAIGAFINIIVSALDTFVKFIVHFNGYPLLFGLFAIFFACRFLLAPWIANSLQGGASDKAKKPKGGNK